MSAVVIAGLACSGIAIALLIVVGVMYVKINSAQDTWGLLASILIFVLILARLIPVIIILLVLGIALLLYHAFGISMT